METLFLFHVINSLEIGALDSLQSSLTSEEMGQP